jgi:hypothetical protein
MFSIFSLKKHPIFSESNQKPRANNSINNYFTKKFMREKLGNYLYETKKEGSKVVVRFYRSGENLKNPDDVVLTLKLDKEDLKTLKKIG